MHSIAIVSSIGLLANRAISFAIFHCRDLVMLNVNERLQKDFVDCHSGISRCKSDLSS